MLCTLIGVIILSINIQVPFNLHLYDDIGDASSSLRGSTSSRFFQLDSYHVKIYLFSLNLVFFATKQCLRIASCQRMVKNLYQKTFSHSISKIMNTDCRVKLNSPLQLLHKILIAVLLQLCL